MKRMAQALIATLCCVAGRVEAQPASAKQLELWRSQLKQAFYIPERLPKPAPEFYGSFAPMPGVVAERVSYRTEYELRVPAMVYRPAIVPKGRMPALVIVNGHGGDKSSWYAFYAGMLYAQAGAVVVTYDPIGSGERSDEHTPVASEHDKPIDVATLPARMGGLMVADIMQAVSYLRERKDVDPRRIGVMGFSMGAFVSSLAGAADPRIHALLLAGGGDLDGPGGYFDLNHLVMCQSGPWKALNVLGDRPAVIYALNASRGPTFIINGTADTVVDIPHHAQEFFADLRRRTIAITGNDRNVFTTYFDAGASHRPSWTTPVAAEWLDSQLAFPNWPASTVAALPTIVIGEWARQNHFSLPKNYDRADRDAGIASIAGKIPALTVAQTDALPREQWDRRKQEFIYASWVSHALAEAEHPVPRLGTAEY